MSTKPLIIIGLDGAPWNLLDPWTEKGLLPNFKKIIESGIRSDLISTIPTITGVALPSFFTGMNPGSTGIFGFFDSDGSLIDSLNSQYPDIWDYLGSVDIKSCIVGLRFTYPPKKINGIMLSGGLLRTERDDFIEPHELISIAKDYNLRKETFPFLYEALRTGRMKQPERFTKELIELTRIQFSIFTKLKDQDQFPFSLFWIENTDVLQHFCWHRPDLILKLYEEIDSLLGDFIQENSDCNLILMSDHGFEKAPSCSFNVNSWLSKEQFLEVDRNIFRKTMRRLKSFAKHYISERFSVHTRYKIKAYLEKKNFGRKKIKAPATFDSDTSFKAMARSLSFNPSKTKAFSKDSFGIYVNKKDDYETIRSDLITRLLDLTDTSGKKVVRSAWKREELYKGSHLNQIPDVVFLPSKDYEASAHFHEKWITPVRGKRKKAITGKHDAAYIGIFIATGSDISTNKLDNFKIIDFLPTILKYFNIEVPDYIDGDQRVEIFKDSGVKQKSLKSTVSLDKAKKDKRPSLSTKEENEIKNRLRNLGYIE